MSDAALIRDVTDWVFDGATFDDGEQAEAMAAWGPWVYECIEMMDGKGTMRHLPEPGAYREQPARDMLIYAVIRGQWVRRMNEKLAAR